MDNVLILGLGNILLRDEGVGPRAVALLRQGYLLPPDVEVCDGDCLALELLPRLEGVSRLVVVDAADLHKDSGAIVRLEGDEIGQRWTWKLSAHQTGLSDLLSAAALMGYKFKTLVLFVMQPALVAPGLNLSPAVQAALPRLVRLMVSELASWGVPLKRRRHPEVSPAAPGR